MTRWYTSVNEVKILDILFRKNIENFMAIEVFFFSESTRKRLVFDEICQWLHFLG